MKDSSCGNYVPTPNSRREFLRQTGLGMGTLAFGTMVADYLVSDAQAEVMANLKPRKAPSPPRRSTSSTSSRAALRRTSTPSIRSRR